MAIRQTTAVKAGSASSQQIRDAWVKSVTQLINQVMDWAESVADDRHWKLERTSTVLSEEITGGAYEVPGISIEAEPGVRLDVEPRARGSFNSDGRVDMLAWPSLFRVMILHKNGTWVVRTDSGIDWPNSWGRETFLQIAQSLLEA